MNTSEKNACDRGAARVGSTLDAMREETAPAPIAVVASSGNPLAIRLLEALRNTAGHRCSPEFRTPECVERPPANCLYVPAAARPAGMAPDLDEAQRVLQTIERHRFRKLILLSSALVYGTGPARQGLAAEDYSQRHEQPHITCAWRALEEMAQASAPERLVVLRVPTLLDASSLPALRLQRRFTLTLPGRNPMIQVLSLSDLARAVMAVADLDVTGVFNVAPDGAVPFNSAIRIAGSVSLPLPHTLQRLFHARESLDFLRHSSTISNRKMKERLAMTPLKSSVDTLLAYRHSLHATTTPSQDFDAFGMNQEFIRRCGRTWFRFLSDYYWRIEAQGLDHIPRQGRAVLVGTHRGFIPWDAIMALHVVVRETGRIPRFLTHPGLFKVPFIDSFLTKLGGVTASQQSAGQLLENEALVGIYPEGVRGAFALLRDAYRIQPSWRNTFVKVALRHRAPIIPFVNVGSANSLPVFAQIRSRRWTRISQWPCIPLSSFPLVPVPLPSKWRVQFLPPIELGNQYPPEAAQDSALVNRIGLDVRTRMQSAIDDLLHRRRSIFF